MGNSEAKPVEYREIYESPLTDIPWRESVKEWDSETLMELLNHVEDYKPLRGLVSDDVSFPNVNILLLGSIGVGKSSFFNTVNSVFRGRIFDMARTGTAAKSLTSKFNRYPIMSSRDRLKTLSFRLCDMRGLENCQTIYRNNIRYLLVGNINDNVNFDASVPLEPNSPGFNKRPRLHEQIHCCAIFVDATVAEVLTDVLPDVVENIKQAQDVMNSLDIPQVIVLTKIDQACSPTGERISNVFRSRCIQRCVDKVSRTFGLQRNCVFPVKNYEHETEFNDEVNILVLLAMKEILNKADASLFNYRDRIEREYSPSSLPPWIVIYCVLFFIFGILISVCLSL